MQVRHHFLLYYVMILAFCRVENGRAEAVCRRAKMKRFSSLDRKVLLRRASHSLQSQQTPLTLLEI